MYSESSRLSERFQLTAITQQKKSHQLGLSDRENLTNTLVEVVVFTIMNTIMIEDLLKISIHKYQN